MRLVSYVGGFGRIDGDVVVPMGRDLVAYLAGGPVSEGEAVSMGSLELLAPVPEPGKVVCVGLNYRDHAAESGQPIPDEPVLFGKWANSVIGHGKSILIPPFTKQVDYEAELAVVIGRRALRVAVRRALDHVAGYTCSNDVSARDLQFRGGQWTRGKAIDTFLPLGPWVVTPEDVPDPQQLGIRCLVNGQVKQQSNTNQMIFGVADLVSYISQTITLEPGDVIATGTPSGVGFARTPPTFLQDGDEVSVSIERIGTLTNSVQTLS